MEVASCTPGYLNLASLQVVELQANFIEENLLKQAPVPGLLPFVLAFPLQTMTHKIFEEMAAVADTAHQRWTHPIVAVPMDPAWVHADFVLVLVCRFQC